jgi:hypothetical protein
MKLIILLAVALSAGPAAHASSPAYNVVKCTVTERVNDSRSNPNKEPIAKTEFELSFLGNEGLGEDRVIESRSIPGLKIHVGLGMAGESGKTVGNVLIVQIKDPARNVNTADLNDLYYRPEKGNRYAVARASFYRVYNVGRESYDRVILYCEINKP